MGLLIVDGVSASEATDSERFGLVGMQILG